ncbi:two-component system sensor histidine kinase NtrB [Rubrivivax gelatinosus]|uniref:two-component system sensor histidine kinase NtrB n=1 Tax=Rubrivivax gelatinosus TaxID=28068 RepID=UPI00030A975A|nr:ATP-binding protein [Rubrivivax gelatinosus]MBG6082877.1 signal transduction histidine kinase [Rubrivivax gelatinosus]
MDRVDALLPRYAELLRRIALTDSELERETALGEATELAKTSLADGPAIDRMHELHRRAQVELAQAWCDAPAGSAEHAGRERLVRGDALPLLLALMLPHELAQRAHHEQRWRREHETLVAMFEQTDEMIVVLDLDGQCDDVNPAFCRATGWTRRQAVEGAGAWAEPPSGAKAERRSGPLTCSDGSTLTVQWSISPILGRKGELLNHVCIGRDVGRQQRLEDSLRENDKLRAVATLAGGIAHDFNNLLGSINGLAELCELEAVPGSRQARNLGRIRLAGDKAAALVRQMLDFSRQEPPAPQRIGLREWLAHAEGLLRAALPHQQTLAIAVAVDSIVRIDLVQMEQVLLNIVRNAAQAMGPDGGQVRITADRGRPTTIDATDGTAPEWARVCIADAGSGIPAELLGKIFEPFFTTKPVGEGTGLGLAAAHGIVRAHGGVIEVDSLPGVGSTFSIFLPPAGHGDHVD